MVFVCTKCKREVDTPGLFCPFCGTPAPPPETEASDPIIGQTVAAKYFVNQRLGRGGMGQVYRATDVVLDRTVALKMLNRSLLADPSMVQRFHREARAASRLNHPNCITILDFGQTEDEAFFIAMEFLGGRSLAKLLADEAPLAQGRVVRIVAQILAALAEAHANGIIHRDLKLSNVMIEQRREEPDFVKVLDFGIAKLSGAGEGAGQLTGTGIVCGTPGYMSPEQARGEELDARSDLYAVGVMLYELLTSRLPFESETPMGFVAKHMTEIAVSPRERRPDLDLSPDLDALVMRALAKERAERPATAEEMRELLLACPVPRAEPLRPTPRPASSSTVMIPAVGREPTPARAPAVRQPDPKGTPAPAKPAPRPPTPAKAAPRPPTPASKGPAPAPKGPTPAPAAALGGGGAATPAPSRPAPRAAAARPRPVVRRRPSRNALAGAIGGAALLLAGALYLMLRSDPFAAPPPADDDAGLALRPGASPRPPVATPPVATPPEVAPAAASPEVPPPPPATPSSAAPDGSAPGPSAPAVVAAAPPAALPEPPKAATSEPRSAAKRKKGAGVLEVIEGMNVMRVPPEASGQGVLTISASPWAVVTVDGKELGETPRELRVYDGYYRVKLSHPTLGTRETTLTVRPGRRAAYNVSFSL